MRIARPPASPPRFRGRDAGARTAVADARHEARVVVAEPRRRNIGMRVARVHRCVAPRRSIGDAARARDPEGRPVCARGEASQDRAPLAGRANQHEAVRRKVVDQLLEERIEARGVLGEVVDLRGARPNSRREDEDRSFYAASASSRRPPWIPLGYKRRAPTRPRCLESPPGPRRPNPTGPTA